MLFIQHVTESRDVFDFHLNFGIDGGGGSLKFTLSIQAKKGSSQITEKWKDTGVKKIFIIALAPSTQENYNNIASIWAKLKITDCLNQYLATLTTDLKLANIIVGMTSSSSYYPCIWCDVSKDDLGLCGNLRTSASCFSNYKSWLNDGSVKKKAKNFQNCIHAPLFYSENEEQLILHVMPPPELHLLLGCVNKLYTHLQEHNSNIATKWAQECYVEKKYTNGGKFSFEGNACKKLVKNVDKLQKICEAEGDFVGMLYVDTFRKFRVVVDDCFSSKLKPNFEQHIKEFKESYEQLGISVTPKVHTIFHHVTQFCLKYQMGLGYFAEQATESVHHDFNEKLTNYKAPKISENFMSNHLRAVRSYNSSHL